MGGALRSWLRGKTIIPEYEGEPSLTCPVSQACTQSQIAEPAYAYWCRQICEEPRAHRKQWEFCFILQALATRGLLAPDFRGLGFGVGEEPLSALFARHGVQVTATDLDSARAAEAGWTQTAQHARALADLNQRGICPPERFADLVSFRAADMNAIPATLKDYDFVWSACALEHLGSIKAGGDFILKSLRTLKPGGVAVHTTEYNINNVGDTLDCASTVLFRRRDLERIIQKAIRQGFRCQLNWSVGREELDFHVDVAPYSSDKHLKLRVGSYVTTSFGLIIEKPG